MNSLRSLFGVSLAHLMVLSTVTPVCAEENENQERHRRAHGRRHVHVVSHDRADYPVILNWIASPDSSAETEARADGSETGT
jgi:hypothetical protein